MSDTEDKVSVTGVRLVTFMDRRRHGSGARHGIILKEVDPKQGGFGLIMMLQDTNGKPCIELYYPNAFDGEFEIVDERTGHENIFSEYSPLTPHLTQMVMNINRYLQAGDRFFKLKEALG